MSRCGRRKIPQHIHIATLLVKMFSLENQQQRLVWDVDDENNLVTFQRGIKAYKNS